LLDKGDKTQILKNDFLLGTANLIIRKKFFNLMGGFDESFANQQGLFKIFGGEDIDFVQRAINRGYQVVYYPKLLVFHKILPFKFTKGYFRKRYFEQGKEIANFDRIHRRGDSGASRCWNLIKGVPLDIRRTFSEYLFQRPQNFYHEVHFFYTGGYLLANIVFSLKRVFFVNLQR